MVLSHVSAKIFNSRVVYPAGSLVPLPSTHINRNHVLQMKPVGRSSCTSKRSLIGSTLTDDRSESLQLQFGDHQWDMGWHWTWNKGCWNKTGLPRESVSLPSALSAERTWQSCYLNNFKPMIKAMKKFLKESVIAYSFWCPLLIFFLEFFLTSPLSLFIITA